LLARPEQELPQGAPEKPAAAQAATPAAAASPTAAAPTAAAAAAARQAPVATEAAPAAAEQAATPAAAGEARAAEVHAAGSNSGKSAGGSSQKPAPSVSVTATRGTSSIPEKPAGTAGKGAHGPFLVGSSVHAPDYTGDALAAAFEGMLVVEVVVDENGRVVKAVLQNPSRLGIDAGVIAVARQARYAPAVGADGQRKPAQARLNFNFRNPR
jgi:TonB family protein